MSIIRGRRLIGLLLAVLLLVRAGAPAVAATAVDPYARSTTPVADHIWLIYRTYSSTEAPFEGNVEVFEQSDGLVVVDAGGCPLSGEHVVRQIRALSAKPVKYLVYTHYHGDHNLGAGAFRRAWPNAVVISTAATRDNMTSAPMNYIKTYGHDYQGMIDYAERQLTSADLPESKRRGWQRIADIGPAMVAAYSSLAAYPADLTFVDRVTIPDAVTPVEVRFLGRANTDGDAVAWAPKQRVIAAGDIVVSPIPYASASYISDWIDVLGKLRAIDYAALVPGHGRVQSDKVYIDKLIRALMEIRSRIRSLVASGTSLEDIQKQTIFDGQLSDFAGDDEWQRALMRSFFLKAIVSNAYKEATGEQIVQGRDGG